MAQPRLLSDADLKLNPVDAKELRLYASALQRFGKYLNDADLVTTPNSALEKLELAEDAELDEETTARIIKGMATLSNACMAAYKKHQHVNFFYRYGHNLTTEEQVKAYTNEYIRTGKKDAPLVFPANNRNQRNMGFLTPLARDLFKFVMDRDDKRGDKGACSWGTRRMTGCECAYHHKREMDAHMDTISAEEEEDAPRHSDAETETEPRRATPPPRSPDEPISPAHTSPRVEATPPPASPAKEATPEPSPAAKEATPEPSPSAKEATPEPSPSAKEPEQRVEPTPSPAVSKQGTKHARDPDAGDVMQSPLKRVRGMWNDL